MEDDMLFLILLAILIGALVAIFGEELQHILFPNLHSAGFILQFASAAH